jgi:hypothetical protein
VSFFWGRGKHQSFFATLPLSHISVPWIDIHTPPVEVHTVRASARRSLTRSSAVVILKSAAAMATATTAPNVNRVMLIFMIVLLMVGQRKLKLKPL